jgi:hypothetical protein
MFVHELYTGMVPITSSYGKFRSSATELATTAMNGEANTKYAGDLPVRSTVGMKQANISELDTTGVAGLGQMNPCGPNYCGEEVV